MKKYLPPLLILCSILGSTIAEPVKLVTAGNFLPFTDEQWKGRGMLVQVVDQIMRVANLDHEVIFQANWNTMLADTESGQFDATFPWYYNDERAKRFFYTDSLVSNYIMAFVPMNSDVQATSREELVGYRFCRPQGYFMHDLVDLLEDPRTTIEQPETLNGCFQLMKDGQVDIIPVDLFTSFDAIQTVFGSSNAVRRLSFVFSRQKLHIMVPKKAEGAQELVDRLNKAIATLELRGILQAIRDNHTSMFLSAYE